MKQGTVATGYNGYNGYNGYRKPVASSGYNWLQPKFGSACSQGSQCSQ